MSSHLSDGAFRGREVGPQAEGPRAIAGSEQQLPKETCRASSNGTGLCLGCGEPTTLRAELRVMADVLGPKGSAL